jgi:hypothetical protein
LLCLTTVIASEAKQSIAVAEKMDCFVACAPRNDEGWAVTLIASLLHQRAARQFQRLERLVAGHIEDAAEFQERFRLREDGAGAPARRRQRPKEPVSMKASLSACRFASAAYISVAAIMPHAVHCGKPRAEGSSHALALQ